MTRPPDRLRVGTTKAESGRVHLREYAAAEQDTITMPGRRKERAVLTTATVTEGNVDAAVGGPAISEYEHEVVLHEERAVVKQTVDPSCSSGADSPRHHRLVEIKLAVPRDRDKSFTQGWSRRPHADSVAKTTRSSSCPPAG